MARLKLKVDCGARLSMSIGHGRRLKLLSNVQIVDNLLPTYAGITEVTPTLEEQYLLTERTSVYSDITVHAIPYQSVSNEAGGRTATIG